MKSSMMWIFPRRNCSVEKLSSTVLLQDWLRRSTLVRLVAIYKYVSHCQAYEHSPNAVHVVANHYSYDKENLPDNMLDKSWLGMDEFEDEMCILVNKDNTIMFLICSVTLDLVDEYEEMCSLASKVSTLLSLMFSVTLDLTDVVEDL